MDSIRQHKISRLLQKEIGAIFTMQEVSISGGTMISVTQVRVTSDLGIARIYVSIFPAEDREEIVAKINEQAGEIRFVLGKKVGQQLRHIPNLHFYLDDSFDYAETIDQLLK